MFSTLLVLAALADPTPTYDIHAWLRQEAAAKPVKPVGPAGAGDDSCRHANDGECDEPGIGTGLCAAGTDTSDCWRIATGQEDDSCQWANDGECDEPRIGTGACTQGTDRTDCGDIAHLRFRDDSCATAFDGVCNEPGIGDGTCEARTDRADCVGRERPLTLNDHFFGYDDREVMDRSEYPWSAIGELTMDVGGDCTAALVAPDVLVTALHCLIENGALHWPGLFRVGEEEARIVDFLHHPDWTMTHYLATRGRDAMDWALVRIDRPLGEAFGYLGVAAPDDLVERELHQAGFSWDTGLHLSGHRGCRATEIHPEGTMAHECDTTRGDSGSPFLVRDGDEWFVVATDSRFESNKAGPMNYIAVRASQWAGYFDDFVAGNISSMPAPVGKFPTKPGAAPLK